MDDEEERYELTDKGRRIIKQIDVLYRTTTMTIEEIAETVGVLPEDVGLLYALGEYTGVLGD